MSTEIRLYDPKDKATCIEAFKSNVPKYFTEDEVALFDVFLDEIAHPEISNQTYYYVILENDEVVGCGGFGIREGAKDVTLAWGLVHNNHHKTNLGVKLLSYRLEQIQIHFPNADVYIDTTQHTYTFFEKYGFVTTKITEDFYAKGLHRYDMVLKYIS
ncbi:MAG: GNAT family N-acetyltransferase [Bacteroidetes bacterium]|nr:GNAT family N-acetyltransferase [Bacteroidota bacterium]